MFRHKISQGVILNGQTNGIFQLNVKNKEGKEGVWVYVILSFLDFGEMKGWRGSIDLKNEGKVSKGSAKKAGKWSHSRTEEGSNW
jgi:hypothetical protein